MRSQNTACPGGAGCTSILRDGDVGRRPLVGPAVVMGLLAIATGPVTVIGLPVDDPIALVGQPDYQRVRTLWVTCIVVPPGVPHGPRRRVAQQHLLARVDAAIDFFGEALPLVLLREGIAPAGAGRGPARVIRGQQW